MLLDDELGLAPEPVSTIPPWKLLIVDDEPEIHAVTRLVLGEFKFEGRGLQFLSAYSGAEGKKMLESNPDVALMLLDVVMESDQAGLEVAKHVREVQENRFVRIVLRTGQPGQAPEARVTTDYDINDYKEKTELTTQKLTATVRVALRGYRDIMLIERSRNGLERVIHASAHIFSQHKNAEFASAVLNQLGTLVGLDRGALYCRVPPPKFGEPRELPEHFTVSAAMGEYERYIASNEHQPLPENLEAALREAMQLKQHLFRADHYVLHFSDSQHGESLLYVGEAWNLLPVDFRLVELFCTNVSIAYENLHLNQELFEAQLEMICLMAGAAETRSKETAHHVQRIGILADLLAVHVGLDAKSAEGLRFAAPLHDIGKIGIPDLVLNKPGKHSADEWGVMRTHAEVGAQMLAGSKRPLFQLAAEIARSHHENWDGSGYPAGLKGDEIPMSGRIVSLMDVFDALGSERCYKDPWPEEEIHKYIVEQRGLKFDPHLVDTLLNNWAAFANVRAQIPD